jgi:DNA-binding IclR family transcriptional regulator
MARRLQIDPASAYRMLRTMRAEGLVEQDTETRKYRLGLGILELASGLLQQSGIVGVAIPFLEELHAQTQETVCLDACNGSEVVCIAALNCRQEVRTTSFVGERAPLHATSSGQIFLAYMPTEEQKLHLRKRLASYTPKTIVDQTHLTRLLSEIARSGVAISDESYHRGVRGISAPVFSAKTEVVAAVSATVPKQRLSLKQITSFSKLVKAAASSISGALKKVDTHASIGIRLEQILG